MQSNKRNQLRKKDPIPLTAIEMEQIRKACRTIREKAIVEFFYSTGCRVTELIRMDKKDVDFERCEVYLFGKGNKHRTSYLSARAKLMLIDYLKSRKAIQKHFLLEKEHRMRDLKSQQ